MKKIAIFDDFNPRITVEGCDFISPSNSNVRNFLENYGDPASTFKKDLKRNQIRCVVVNLTLGYDDSINLGLCLALIAHHERIPFVFYARKDIMSEQSLKTLRGVIEKITKKQVLQVIDNDFSEVASEIKKLLEPVSESD